jgi:predicted dehydrogenase
LPGALRIARQYSLPRHNRPGRCRRQARAAAAGKTIKPKPINTYQAEIEEFSDAILKKRTPANNAELGLQSQKVIAACYLSAKTGKTVKI